MDVIIYHNPGANLAQRACDDPQFRVEPHIIEYLKCPPTRLLLTQLLARAGLTVRNLAREGTPFTSSASAIPRSPTSAARRDRRASDPDEPPLVVTPKGCACVALGTVLDLLPPQRGQFIKEDGERVVDDAGRPVASA